MQIQLNLGQAPEKRVVVNIAKQIAVILEALHYKQVAHRDVKPENFMLGPDGIVKIIDFGAAKRFSDPDSTLKSAEGTAT